MLRQTLIAATVAAFLVGCGQAPANATKPEAEVAKPMLLTSADITSLNAGAIGSGPIISGSLQPEKRADLRAEVSAVVLQVLKDNGDKVRKGDLLVRLDDTAIRDGLNSAEEAKRAAQQSFDQTQRQLERLKTLSTSGAVSQQAMEDAEIRRNNAQSDLVAASTRVVQARQQLERTEVRAPFDGVISSREVSNGDTAQMGKALLKVIDPRSVRFEGFIPADQSANIQVGQPVQFRISGYNDQIFDGKVQRVNPLANAATRQVGVTVSVDWEKIPAVAGLYAEGYVQSSTRDSLLVPISALVIEGDKNFVWIAKDNVLSKKEIKVGARDARSGAMEVLTGLTAHEQILSHPSSSLVDGAKYELQVAMAAPGASINTANTTTTTP